jgi:hypothetical protein
VRGRKNISCSPHRKWEKRFNFMNLDLGKVKFPDPTEKVIFFLFILFFVFEKGSSYVTQAALNSMSSCLGLPSAGIAPPCVAGRRIKRKTD